MVLLSRSFSQGLRIIAPLAITIFVVYWLGALLEALLGRWIRLLFPDSISWVSWRGAGVLLSLGVIFFLGFLFYLPPLRTLFNYLERGFERIPVVRTIYGSSRDLIQYFVDTGGPHAAKRFSKVVLVTLGETSCKVVGLVTQEEPSRLPKGVDQKDHVLVYLPMSYQLGGYTVLVPKNQIEPIPLSVEEALRFTVTAGVSANHPQKSRPTLSEKRV